MWWKIWFFRTKSNFLKRLYGSRLSNSTLQRPHLYHSVCILNIGTDLSSSCLDFNENTEVSISQNYFNLHFNLGLLRKPRKHNFRERIYQKGGFDFHPVRENTFSVFILKRFYLTVI